MLRIQKIGHVGLYCRDIKKMTEFYTEVLGFQLSDINERGMVFLRYGTDHHNIFLCPASESKEKTKGQPGLHHIAFEVGSLEDLKRVKKYLASRGFGAIGNGKIMHRPTGSNYDFDILDPEGNTIQFYSEMDQIGWDGKSRPKELRREFAVEDD
jgi:catechol 2,3-dioxygenase